MLLVLLISLLIAKLLFLHFFKVNKQDLIARTFNRSIALYGFVFVCLFILFSLITLISQGLAFWYNLPDAITYAIDRVGISCFLSGTFLFVLVVRSLIISQKYWRKLPQSRQKHIYHLLQFAFTCGVALMYFPGESSGKGTMVTIWAIELEMFWAGINSANMLAYPLPYTRSPILQDTWLFSAIWFGITLFILAIRMIRATKE